MEHDAHIKCPMQQILGIDICWGCVAQIFQESSPHFIKRAALREIGLVLDRWPHEELSEMAEYIVTSTSFFDSAVRHS